MTVERKYALTKNAPGDYCLPSNDARIIWRIARYIDGPTNGLDIPRDREFWGVWKWDGEVGPGEYIDTGSWNRWNMHDSGFDARREAIDAALGAKAARGEET